MGAATQPRRDSLDRAGTAPAEATRRAALPTAGTARIAMWEAAAATALHRAVTVRVAAALPTADLDRTVMLGTTRAAPVEASTTVALAAADNIIQQTTEDNIIHMETTDSRFLWAASSKAGRRRMAASTFPENRILTLEQPTY